MESGERPELNAQPYVNKKNLTQSLRNREDLIFEPRAVDEPGNFGTR